MGTSTSSTGAGRRLRKARGEDGRTPASRRLKALAQAFAKDAGLDNTLTEIQNGACRRAAAGTLQLETMDAALGRGEEIDALAYSRLDGVVRRNLRALGLEENDDPSSAPTKIGKKNVPLMSINEQINADLCAKLAAAKDELERAYIVHATPYLPRIVRASCVRAIASATPKEAQFFHIRLAAMDDAEANPEANPKKTGPTPDKNFASKKSFTAHRDSSRSDE